MSDPHWKPARAVVAALFPSFEQLLGNDKNAAALKSHAKAVQRLARNGEIAGELASSAFANSECRISERIIDRPPKTQGGM